jgi:Domain of unknown function (DUF1877)
MGVVASYARMDAEDVEELHDDPDVFWELQERWTSANQPDADALTFLYLDKDWENLSWLCSALGRVEARNEAAFIRVSERKFGGEDFSAAGSFQAALSEESEAMGFRYVDPDSLPDDPVLKAIQGRRKGDVGPMIDGLGTASVWRPEEVRMLAQALDRVSESEMRERFDVGEMEVLGLPGDGEMSDLEDFILPQFRRLRALYNRAAQDDQCVVVVLG